MVLYFRSVISEHLLWIDFMSTQYRETSSQVNAREHMEGLVQDCSDSIANALELLQSCTIKPSVQ